jgi:hypothetical protein
MALKTETLSLKDLFVIGFKREISKTLNIPHKIRIQTSIQFLKL